MPWAPTTGTGRSVIAPGGIFSIALSVDFLELVLDEVLFHEVLERWTR